MLYDFCENIRFPVKRGREKGATLRAKRGEKFPPNRKGMKFSLTQGQLEPAIPSNNTINRAELGGEEWTMERVRPSQWAPFKDREDLDNETK